MQRFTEHTAVLVDPRDPIPARREVWTSGHPKYNAAGWSAVFKGSRCMSNGISSRRVRNAFGLVGAPAYISNV